MKSCVLSVRLTEHDKNRLKTLSDQREWSSSYMAHKLIREGLDRYERPKRADQKALETGADVLPILESEQAPTHSSTNS